MSSKENEVQWSTEIIRIFFQSESVLEITKLQKDPAVSKMNVFLSRRVHCKDSRI